MMERGFRRVLTLALVLCALACGPSLAEESAALSESSDPQPTASIAPQLSWSSATSSPAQTLLVTVAPSATATPLPSQVLPTASTSSSTETPLPDVTSELEDVECSHEQARSDSEYRQIAYSEADDQGHTVSFYEVALFTCDDCDKSWEVWPEQRTVQRESHTYEGNVCLQCGYENSCIHKRMQEELKIFEENYLDADTHGHTYSYYEVKICTCLDCGESWEEWPERKTTLRESHRYTDNVCALCGYENICSHANAQSCVERRDLTYTGMSADGHSVSFYETTLYSCPDCGDTREERPEKKTTRQEKHSFSGGVCTLCGYENTCKHPNAQSHTERRDPSYADAAADGHSVSFYEFMLFGCPDCGETWEECPEEKFTLREEHSYTNGACSLCGYIPACSHAQLHDYILPYEVSYSELDASAHTVTYYAVTAYACTDCGETWEKWPEEKTRLQEKHSFQDGICRLCGYENTCTHENSDSIYQRREEIYSDADEGGHIVSYYEVAVTQCGNCGEIWESWPEKKTTLRENHHFENGKCAQCGYCASEPTPTAMSTVEPPEPTFIPIPRNEVVHGVKAEDAANLEEVLLAVMEDLEASPEVLSVQIINAEEVLAEEEAVALKQLSPEEQLAVFLPILGFEFSNDQEESSFSPQALDLKAQIRKRIHTMSAAQRTEYASKLEEYFSKTAQGDEESTQPWFQLVLEIQENSGVHLERYGFCRDRENWAFALLEIAQ